MHTAASLPVSLPASQAFPWNQLSLPVWEKCGEPDTRSWDAVKSAGRESLRGQCLLIKTVSSCVFQDVSKSKLYIFPSNESGTWVPLPDHQSQCASALGTPDLGGGALPVVWFEEWESNSHVDCQGEGNNTVAPKVTKTSQRFFPVYILAITDSSSQPIKLEKDVMKPEFIFYGRNYITWVI